jgi:hypothetical protein
MKRLNIYFIFSLLNVSLLFAQEPSLKTMVGSFVKYTENHPVEKIYLHLDKPYYAAGEYMYFHAYLTDMQLDQNETGSLKIYVEINDSEKNLVSRAILYSEQNEYADRILLPDSLPSAVYHLRALPSPRAKGVPSVNSAGFSNVPVIYDVDGTRMLKEGFESTYGSMQARLFEMVEVISPEDALPIYGREAMNGAYVFKIKKFTGSEGGSLFNASGYTFRPGGYSVQKEFYMPAYDNGR